MDNEMISQLQFDRIKKEIQARAIGNYSKKRISDMTVSTNLQTVLDRQEETRSTLDLRKQSACSIYGVAEDRCTDRTSQKRVDSAANRFDRICGFS